MTHHLAPILAAWRAHEGLTQKEAGDRVGITQASWSRIESGARWPDDETARLLIKHGVVSEDDLAKAFIGRLARAAPTEAAA